MATIQNRSRITVTVKNRPDVTRSFPYNALDKVEAYVKELRSQRFRPEAKQGDDTWEVRVRDKGYPQQNITCPSRKEAEALVKKLDAERSTGLVRDYTKAHKVTFAHLLVRYLREFKKKSAQVVAYKIEAWLEDSGDAGKRLLADHRAERAAAGLKVRKATFKMRETILGLEWIHKPLSLVTADDINAYVDARQSQVLDGTVDREIDHLSSIFNKATVEGFLSRYARYGHVPVTVEDARDTGACEYGIQAWCHAVGIDLEEDSVPLSRVLTGFRIQPLVEVRRTVLHAIKAQRRKATSGTTTALNGSMRPAHA